MSSPDDTCAILSVQNITCPVYDLDLNIKFDGSYLTADRLGNYLEGEPKLSGMNIFFEGLIGLCHLKMVKCDLKHLRS